MIHCIITIQQIVKSCCRELRRRSPKSAGHPRRTEAAVVEAIGLVTVQACARAWGEREMTTSSRWRAHRGRNLGTDGLVALAQPMNNVRVRTRCTGKKEAMYAFLTRLRDARHWGRLPAVIPVAVLALVLAGSLTGCTATSASTQNTGSPQTSSGTDGSPTLIDTITVNGTGNAFAAPDRAEINVGIQTQAATAAEALTTNSRDVEGLIARLKTEGVPAEDIRTSNLNLWPIHTYDPQTGQQSVQFYQADNTVMITVTDVDILGEVLGAAAEAGGNFISGLQMSLSDDTEASSEALAAAMAKAKTKAEALATAAGVKLGDVIAVRESTVSPVPLYYEGRANDGDLAANVPVSAGQLQIGSSVDVTFRIVR